MIRAFLFDLDGTLLDTEKLWVQATRAWLLDRGVPCTPEQATKLVYGHSWHDIYTQLAARHPQLAVGETQAGLDLRPFFAKMRQPGHVIIASSVALLKQLAAQHPVAIVSGSPRADVADGIALMGVDAHVRFFLGSEDYGAGKPDPACFLMAAQRLAVPPSQCLVFEDSSAGVRAAKSAGMMCVALARADAPAQDVSPADLVLADLAAFDRTAFAQKS